MMVTPAIQVDPQQELFLKSALFQQAYESFAIYAAYELGIFRHLSSRKVSAQKIAALSGLNETSIKLLMNCLVTAGILESDGRSYTVRARFRKLLSPKNRKVQEMLEVCRNQCRLWVDAAEIIRQRTESHDILERFARGPAWTSQYLERVEAKNRRHAQVTASLLAGEILTAKTALDLGGGHGYYTKQLLAVNPRLKVAIYDLKAAIEYCRTHMKDDPGFARIRFIVGDARTLALKDAFDLCIISDLLHYFTEAEKKETLRRSLEALAEGGLLVVSKFRLNRSGSEPRFSSFFALQKHLENPNGGYLETDVRTAELLREAGAEYVEVIVLNEEKSLVIGRRSKRPSSAEPAKPPSKRTPVVRPVERPSRSKLRRHAD